MPPVAPRMATSRTSLWRNDEKMAEKRAEDCFKSPLSEKKGCYNREPRIFELFGLVFTAFALVIA